MIIYIDVIFLTHLIINYFLIEITEKVLKLNSKITNKLVASVIATLYSLVAIIFNIKCMNGFACKLLLAILIICIAFKPKDVGDGIKITMMFYSITCFLGGVAMSLLYNIENEQLCIFFSIVIFIFLVDVIMKILRRTNFICNIEITINGKAYIVKALIDTGHDLHDAITGETVVIVSEKKIKEISEKLYLMLKGFLLDIPIEYETKIRMITYNSLGMDEGIMYGIKVDRIISYYNGKAFENMSAIVALVEKDFRKFDAIVGLNLIEEGSVYGNSFIAKIKS